ncbi:ABC transporter ATP-binding protein [Salipaludibacillus keqinensis]|uniref:ABC transporter ATP-binding protein n=1 Tax=Salipaludibacillus keqinensis TaxID=2045207 RepID=UPI001304C4E7|nr:ABC transporter ATP-binding protein [Salipaludibacillus keqinensis]
MSKKYLNQTALTNITFQLTKSGIYGVIGPNGSGKTTLLKIMAGLLRSSKGTVEIMEKPVTRLSSQHIAFLSEADSLYSFQTVNQMVDFCHNVMPDFSKDKALNMIQSLNIEKDKKIKHLSKGNRARVKIVLTLSRQVPVLLMDEPLSGLDPLVREDILRMIVMNVDVEEQILVLSTHEVSEVEPFLDHVIFMKNGTCLLEKSVEQLREEKGQSVVEAMREVLS